MAFLTFIFTVIWFCIKVFFWWTIIVYTPCMVIDIVKCVNQKRPQDIWMYWLIAIPLATVADPIIQKKDVIFVTQEEIDIYRNLFLVRTPAPLNYYEYEENGEKKKFSPTLLDVDKQALLRILEQKGYKEEDLYRVEVLDVGIQEILAREKRCEERLSEFEKEGCLEMVREWKQVYQQLQSDNPEVIVELRAKNMSNAALSLFTSFLVIGIGVGTIIGSPTLIVAMCIMTFVVAAKARVIKENGAMKYSIASKISTDSNWMNYSESDKAKIDYIFDVYSCIDRSFNVYSNDEYEVMCEKLMDYDSTEFNRMEYSISKLIKRLRDTNKKQKFDVIIQELAQHIKAIENGENSGSAIYAALAYLERYCSADVVDLVQYCLINGKIKDWEVEQKMYAQCIYRNYIATVFRAEIPIKCKPPNQFDSMLLVLLAAAAALCFTCQAYFGRRANTVLQTTFTALIFGCIAIIAMILLK